MAFPYTVVLVMESTEKGDIVRGIYEERSHAESVAKRMNSTYDVLFYVMEHRLNGRD